MAVHYNSRITTDGLVLCLDAGNTKSYPGSGTTWTDLSGNSNTGTLTNGPTYSSSNGGGIVFDGANDYTSLASNNVNGLSAGTSNFSILAWVKYNSTASYSAFFEKQNSNSSSAGTIRLEMGYTPTAIYFTTSNGATAISQGAFTYTINSGTWYHFALTCGGSSKIGYVNGVQAYTESFTSLYPDNTYQLGISGWGRPLNGNISHFSMYNKALTAAEVQQNFNALRGRYNI